MIMTHILVQLITSQHDQLIFLSYTLDLVIFFFCSNSYRLTSTCPTRTWETRQDKTNVVFGTGESTLLLASRFLGM